VYGHDEVLFIVATSNMRIFTASLATETNTFAPMPTGLASFKEAGYFPAGSHPDAITFFAAPLWALRRHAVARGWSVIEGLVAGAQPSGVTTKEAYESLRDELLADLRGAMPVDMVLLGLHGAMVAEGYDDCEGDLLSKVRDIVGPGVVIGAELDPHNHLTDAMVTSADLLVCFKQYPHTDIYERAIELMDICAAQAAGRVKPVASVVDCQMVTIIHTTAEPARSFIQRLQALEGRDGVLSISLTHGFPWGDVPDMGTKVLVYTDNNQPQGDALARRLADELIAMRQALATPWHGIDQAIDLALAAPPGMVVIADSADNPGGGAAGDSTFILHRLLERGIRQAAVGPLWDPVAVRIAFDAGVGARLKLRVGGKVGPMSGDPLDLDCVVKQLVPAMTMAGLGGTREQVGDSALIEAQGVQIVLISVRHQAMGADVFTGLGCDLAAQRIVVVKSSQHFRAAFEPLAVQILYASAPGSVTSDFRALPYTKVARPKWPLDDV
jgi:microcystin degradation protein MlrC